MTTTPTPATAPDQQLAHQAVGSGQFLAGLIAAAMLDTAGRPDKLAADLFPHLPAEEVAAVWQRALVVGYRAGRFAGAPRFHRDTLARLRRELADAGWEAMANLAEEAVAVAHQDPVTHPADVEADTARGDHW